MNTDLYQKINQSLTELGPCSGTIEQSAYDKIDQIFSLIRENFTPPPTRKSDPNEHDRLGLMVTQYLNESTRVEADRIWNEPDSIDPRIYPIWVMRMIIHDQGGGLGYGKMSINRLKHFDWFHRTYGQLILRTHLEKN